MPTINVAMERSLRRGFVDLLAASLRPVLGRRDEITSIPGQIESVQTAFSSWGNCMQAAFCKWPVIAVIVIGGLIVASIIWCIARCACCGLSCCCQCCQCLKCCGDCCGCCDPPRGTPHKHLDDQYGHGPPAPPKGAYRSEAPMALPRAAVAEPPQYAEFDVSRKADPDALPAMPNWENAGKKKIMLEEEEVEMDQLKKPENGGQSLPLMAGAGTSPGPASPSHSPSPYGANDMYAASGGFVSAGASNPDPYAQGEQSQHLNPQGYGPSSSSLGTSQGYGMAGAAAMGPGRRSPRDPRDPQDYGNAGYGQGYGQGYANPSYPPSSRSPQGEYDGYGRARQGSYDDYNQPGAQTRGMGPNRRSPPRGAPGPNVMGGAYAPDSARPPLRAAPQGDYGYGGHSGQSGYGSGPQRQYSSDSTRPFARPDATRQYSHDAPPASPVSLLNNGGFDFNSGYSRPTTAGESSAGARPSRGGQQQESAAYPGYRAYRAPADNRRQDGWSGV